MKAAASQSFGYNTDPIVSSDVIGMRFGSLFDSTQDYGFQRSVMIYIRYRLFPGMTTRISYTSQMVRTIKYFAELG